MTVAQIDLETTKPGAWTRRARLTEDDQLAIGTSMAIANGKSPQISAEQRLERIAAVLTNPTKPSSAMLRVKIRAIYEGIEVPTDRRAFIALAQRARTGGERERYQLWTKEFGSNVAAIAPAPAPGEEPRAVAVPPEAPPPPKVLSRAAVARTIKAQSPTALYRWWDELDFLLYIGIAKNLGFRTSGHDKRSSWMDFAVRSTVEHLPTRTEAVKAEQEAVQAELPLFNIQYNDTPEAQRRLVEYLIMRDRLDLLAPMVTRA